MLIGELINNLAQKAGVSADDDRLKSLLASPELATINVDDDLVTSLDSGLLNIEAAKNNHPDIKKVYTAAAYDGMDKHLLSLIASDTFDQEDIDEIKAERSTSKKAELIISKLKSAKAQAKGADKEEINRQLTAAHEAARLAKTEVENVKNEYEGKIKSIHRDAALTAAIANYKTIYDELPGKAKINAMRAVLEESLQDKNAELKADDNGTLQLVSKDGSNVFGSNHVQLTPQSFLDQTFAPILKVSGPPKPAAQQTRQTLPPGATPPANDANTGFLKSINEQAIADMAMPSSSLV